VTKNGRQSTIHYKSYFAKEEEKDNPGEPFAGRLICGFVRYVNDYWRSGG